MKPPGAASLAMFFTLLTGVARAGDLPDSTKTPGVPLHAVPAEAAACLSRLMGQTVRTGEPISRDMLCADRYTTCIRDVTDGEKKRVYQRYGLSNNRAGYCSGPEGCEVDHLISLEIGGANDINNLWPQPYQGTTWNARVKDDLEKELQKMVCAGRISLEQAQKEIATDWISARKKCLGNK